MALLSFSGCNEESSTSTTTSSVHFQGRDCLSCHNKDLKVDSYLSLAGTLFRTPNADKNNLQETCDETLHVELYKDSQLQYNTKDYNPLDAPGFKGRGNIFGLLRNMQISEGTYKVIIRADDGRLLAQSAAETHTFTSSFDPDNPSDFANRHSCNTCHQQPPFNIYGTEGLIYANSGTCN